jgi:hypothetical protein
MRASHFETRNDERASTGGRAGPTLRPATAFPLSSAGLGALGRLIEAHGPDALLLDPMPAGPAEELGAVVRLLCDEARREDPCRAERLIMTLHAAWPTLPAVRRIPPDQHAALLARVITRCIAEFYGSAAGRANDEDPGRRATA